MISRRSVLKSATAAAVTAALSRRSFAAATEVPEVPLAQLDYSAVTLLPGPMQEQFDYHHKLVLRMSNDMLLKPFRERAGLAAPGEDFGGWYSNSVLFDPHYSWDGFCPGHSFGQHVSTLARAGAITGDPAYRTKVEALVTGVAPTLTDEFYANYPLPGYVFDKILLGLVDAHTLMGVKSAKPLAEHTFEVVSPHLPERALSRAEAVARPHMYEQGAWDETYTMGENLFLAYQRMGGNPVFREGGKRFLLDESWFNPLSEGINVMPGEHAYSHVNAFSSAVQAYLTLGSEKHLRAAKNAFAMLEAQSFATGGWGPGETLLRPDTDDLARSLFTTPASFETPCGSYAHFKITRYLLRITGDSHYGDSMERVLYNTVLGAKPIRPDGSAFYYADFTLTGHKTYAKDRWHCCSGTLPQVTADYGISSYLGGVPASGGAEANTNGLTVVLFVPSRVVFKAGGSSVTLTQETTYPAQPTTKMTLKMAKEASFPLAIRIPGWAGPATRVSVNGKPLAGNVMPGTFLRVERSWKSGDHVEMFFDMPLRTEVLTTRLAHVTAAPSLMPSVSPAKSATKSAEVAPVAEHPIRLAALLRGPQVFMATGNWPTQMAEKDLLAATVASAGDSISARDGDGGAVTMKPYVAIADEAYRTYQSLKVV
jgi:DUF1680 family protein